MKKTIFTFFAVCFLSSAVFSQKTLDFGITAAVGGLKLIERKEDTKPPIYNPIDIGLNLLAGNSIQTSLSLWVAPSKTFDYIGHVWTSGWNGYQDDTIIGTRTLSGFAIDWKTIYLKPTDNDFLNIDLGWSVGYMRLKNSYDFPSFNGNTMTFLELDIDTTTWTLNKGFGHIGIIGGVNYELEHFRVFAHLNVKFGFFNSIGNKTPIMPSLMVGAFIPLIRRD